MGRRLRLADGAGSQALKQKRAGMPLALDAPRPQSQAGRRRFGCSTGGNAEKRLLSPAIIAFQNSDHCRRVWANEPGRRALCAPTKPTPAPRRRRRFGRADCARRRSKRQTQRQPPFGAPAFRAHPAARQAKRRPFGAVWSPAPVCHPIRMTSPPGQAGRRDAACSALKPKAALIVAFTQQSEQPLKKAWHSSNCSKMHNNGIISSPICQNTPVFPKFCDLTAQGASGF